MKNKFTKKHKNVLIIKGTQGMAQLSLAVVLHTLSSTKLLISSAPCARMLSFFGVLFNSLANQFSAHSTSCARALSLLGILVMTIAIPASVLFTSTPDTAVAATSNQLNFQGRLLSPTGTLVPDGIYNMEFNLYYVSAGGSTQWTEDRLVTNTQGVTVQNGYFSVYLGEYDAFPAINWSEDLYLGMTIRGTTSCVWGSCAPTDSEMSPRFKLTAVPYAFRASNVASSNTNSASTNSDAITITTGSALGTTSNSGNITIDSGTATGTTGAVTIGSTNASAVLLGRAGLTVAIQGGVSVAETAALNGDVTIGNANTDLLTISSTIQGSNALVFEGATADGFETTLAVQDPTADVTLRLPALAAGTYDICTTSGNCLGTGDIIQGGNSYTTAVTIGTNDVYDLNLETSGVTRVTIDDTTGDVNFTGNLVVAATKSLTLTGGNTASRPASPTEGMIYFDTDTDSLLTYANGKWQSDRGEYIIVASNHGTDPSTQAERDSADYVTDGTADEVEINAALTAASGGKVILLGGTYVAAATILIPNNTTLAGVGAGTNVELGNLDATENLIENTDTTTGTGITIRDLTLDGRNDLNTAGTQYGIYFNTGSSSNIENVYLNRFRNFSIYLQDNSNRNTFDNVKITSGSGDAGIGIDASDYNMVNNINVVGSAGQDNGVEIIGGEYNTVTGSTFSGTFAERAIYMHDGAILNTVSANTINGAAILHAISSETNSGANIITGNTIFGTTGIGIVLNFNSDANTVTNNNITLPGTVGIYAGFSSDNNTIDGNTITYPGGATENDGIVVDGDANQITDNYISDSTCSTACTAIEITANADNTYISGNMFVASSGTAIISNSGTGTTYASQSVAESGLNTVFRQADSTTAFAIQNNAGTSLLNADTSGGIVTITGSASVSGDFTVDTTTLVVNSTTNAVSVGGTLSVTTLGSADTSTFLCRNTSNQLATCSSTPLTNSLTDNVTDAFDLQEGTNNYLNINTTNSSENIAFGNATTNPSYSFLGSGTLTVTGNTQLNGNLTVAAGKYIALTGGNTASRPGSPTEGMVYFDTTTKQLITYANGKWQADRSTATKIVAASNSSQAVKDSADYVADGTGDQTEINAALTAASGGKVYLAEGTYVASATILIPNNTTLAGAGRGTLIELADLDATDNLIENTDQTTGTGVTIRDIRIDGRDDLNTAGTQEGIYLLNMGGGTGPTARQGAKITNVIANNFRTDGVYLESSSNSTLSGNTFQGNFYGLSVYLGAYNTVTNNIAQGNSQLGFYIGTNNNTFTNNIAQGGETGFYTEQAVSNTITGNTTEGNSYVGYYVDDLSSNNVFTGNTSNTDEDYGFYIIGASTYNSFIGNSVRNSINGFRLENASNNNLISGNKIHDSGGATTNNGIYLDASDNNTITGNDISDTGCSTNCYAINIFNSTSDNNYLGGNTFTTSSGTATINDSGTGTRYAGQTTAQNGLDILFKQTNSTTAFRIQDSTGGNGFTVNTTTLGISTGGTLAVTGNTTLTGDLAVNGNDITTGAGDLTITPAGGDTIVTGTLAVTTLGSADTSTFVCRNSSNQLATCSSSPLTNSLTDNITDAFDLQEGANNYFNINTTNSSENISFGNATTNPSYNFLGSGRLTVGSALTNLGAKLAIVGTADEEQLLIRANATQSVSNPLVVFQNSGGTETARITVTDAGIGFGYNTLNANTTGTGNIAIGYASQQLGTGSQNVSLGDGTLASGLFTGSWNTAIGDIALQDNEDGVENVAVGRASLANTVDGSQNTAIGNASLNGNISGIQNVAVGNGAGLLSTGGNNVFMGYNAGDNLTAGGSNIIIGSGIDAVNATGSSQLNIGDTLYGDLANDRIAVGTSTTGTTRLTVDNAASADDLLLLRNNGSNVLKIQGTGITELTPNANNDQLFVVRNVITAEIFTVDTNETTGGSIKVNGGSGTSARLDVYGSASANSLVGLRVNNGVSTGNLVEFQDAGTNVFTIADGGASTFTSTLAVNTLGSADTSTFVCRNSSNQLATCSSSPLTNSLTDNITDSFDLQEGTNNYININTTNSSENISFGNATTNPSYNFLGSGTLTVAGNTALTGNLTVDTNTLFVDATNNSIGIGTVTTTNALLTINGSAPNVAGGSLQIISGTLSSTTEDQFGIDVLSTVSPGASGSSNIYNGIRGSVQSSSGNLSNDALIGVEGTAVYSGTSTLDLAIGGSASVLNSNTGTITDAVGFAVLGPLNIGGGTITNSTGISIANVALGTNNTNLFLGTTPAAGNWNIYSDSTYNNAVAGNLRVGGTSAPTVALDVTGAALISSTLGVTGNTTLTGDLAVQGNTTIGNATTDRLTVTSYILGTNALVFEGATDGNGFATTLAVTDPTANNTITLPNASGTVLLAPAGSGNGLVQVPTSNSAGVAGANVISPTAASIVGLTVNGTTSTAAVALAVAQTGTATAMTVSQTQNNAGLTITANALTTANGLTVSSSGTGLTTGSLISVSSATTGAVATNGIVSLSATGNYTSTSNIGLLSVLANATQAGTIQNIQGNALTTGNALRISSTGTGLTTGSLFYGTSATTGAVATNGIFSLNATGNYTSTSNVGLLNIVANATTAGTVQQIQANALTTGDALNINSSGTGLTTGSLLRVSTATTGAIATDGAVSIQATGNYTSTSGIGLLSVLANTTQAGTVANIQANALTTGDALNISSTGTGLTTGSLLRVSTATTGAIATDGAVSIQATGNYTSTTNVGLLSIQANTTQAGTIQNIQGNALTTGQALYISSSGTGLTTGSLFYGTSATTGAVATNGIFSLNATGNYTSTSNTGLLNVVANATTAGTITNIQGNALTTGTALNVSSTGVLTTTGNLLTLTANSATTATGVLTVNATALTTGAGITVNAGTATAISAGGNITFQELTGTRTLGVQTRTTNVAGTALTVQAGQGGTTSAGGTLTLQGGSGGATSGAGGDIMLVGGTATSGNKGLVVVDTATFKAATVQNFTANANITQANIDAYGSILISGNVAGWVATMTDPSVTTTGRVIYVTNSGTVDMTLSANTVGVALSITLKPASTATMYWNGTDWTAAGASSSTDLQAAYDNTATSAGGAEIVLSSTGTGGLTIRNDDGTAITGGLLEVQSSIGSNLFTVNNNSTEYANNGGAENSTFTMWTAAPTAGGTISRYTTVGDNIATGAGSVFVDSSSTANTGVRNTLTSTLTRNLKYRVSFAIRHTSSSTAFSTLDVRYSPSGSNTDVEDCSTSNTVNYGQWTRITCTFIYDNGTTPTSSNAILITHSDATDHDYYIDNFSTTVSADVNHAIDGSVDLALGTNWVAIGGSVARSTSVLYDTSGSVAATTTAVATRGVYNNLTAGIVPQVSTQYRVAFYARGDGTNTATLAVAYTPDNNSTSVSCTDYSTQVVSATAYTLVTCLLTTSATTPVTAQQLRITQTAGSATIFYVDALTMTLNTNNANNVQIGGANKGGPVTLFTLDRSAGAPIAANNDAYLGSMYYDTTTGRIQCYEADGWGACGAAPDNIVNLNPEYAGAVLNGTGVGTMTADFCSNEVGVLVAPTTGNICATHEARNFYKWTSPQATSQTYSIFVTYQLPATFNGFSNDDTVQLTARVDSTSNAEVTYEMFKSTGSAVTQCGSGETDVIAGGGNTADIWHTYGVNGNEATGCSFNSSSAGNFVIFKINMKANSGANAYVSTLNFVTTGR